MKLQEIVQHVAEFYGVPCELESIEKSRRVVARGSNGKVLFSVTVMRGHETEDDYYTFGTRGPDELTRCEVTNKS